MLTLALVWGVGLVGFVIGSYWGHRHTDDARAITAQSLKRLEEANALLAGARFQARELQITLRNISREDGLLPSVEELSKEVARVHEAWALDQDVWTRRLLRATKQAR